MQEFYLIAGNLEVNMSTIYKRDNVNFHIIVYEIMNQLTRPVVDIHLVSI